MSKKGSIIKPLIVCLICLMAFSAPLSIFAERGPLSYDEVKALVNGKVNSKRIIMLAEEHGINFTLTEKRITELKNVGANEELIASLKKLAVKLEEKMGSLYVTSIPPKAVIFLNGEQKGVTPLLIKDIPPGVVKIVVGKLAGYRDSIKNITIQPREKVTLTVTLEKIITAKFVYEDALALFEKGDYEGAMTKFENLINKFPNDNLVNTAYFWLAECYYNKEDFEKAIPQYEYFIERCPQNDDVPTAMLRQALSFEEIGDQETSLNIFKSIIDRYPHTKEADKAKERFSPSTAQQSQQPSAEQTVAQGMINLTTEPPGAKIYIDGEFKGRTPSNISLPNGTYQLFLHHHLYEPYMASLIVEKDQTKTVNIKLVSENKKEKP